MIERIAILVLAAVLAVPEYGHVDEPVDEATRVAATAAAHEVLETLLTTLDFTAVLDRHFDADLAAETRVYGSMLEIDDTSQVDPATLKRAYVALMNVGFLWT